NRHRAAAGQNFSKCFRRRKGLVLFAAWLGRQFGKGPDVGGLIDQGAEGGELEERRDLLPVSGVGGRAGEKQLSGKSSAEWLHRASPGSLFGRCEVPQLFALGQARGQAGIFFPRLWRLN